jgi:PKD repeat protein
MKVKITPLFLFGAKKILQIFYLLVLTYSLQAQTPVCNAHFTHYTMSNPDSVHFYPTSTSANTYTWTFGDGTSSTSIAPWHFYTASGTYYVCLMVTDSTSGGTCTDTHCDSVHVGAVPTVCNAHFTHYTMSNPDSVHFYPSSTSANTYTWTFGDGTSSTSIAPWHFYSAAGTYYVCLTVTDSTSGGTCTDTWCDSVHVSVVLPPVCDAHFSHYTISNPDSAHFYPTSTTAYTSYYWTFGDGTSSSTQYPWHFYNASGTYYVCLTVTDSTSGGTCTDTHCDSVHVGAIAPVCDAHFTHYSLTSNPDSVHFHPNSTTAYTSYFWTFGDGTTSASHDPWHFYTASGTYYVCLTVTDSTSGGTCTATHCDSVHINVISPPVCDAHFTHYSLTSNPDSVHFHPNSTTAYTSYFWTFGDGTTSTSHDPWHFYTASGTHFV